MAFGDPAVRIRMFLCHALASAGRRDDAITVADEMVRQAHLSGPADESDALATRGMMYAAFERTAPGPRRRHRGRRLGRLAGANLLEHFAALNESWGDAIPAAGASGAVEMARAAAEGYRANGHPDARPDRLHDARRGGGGHRSSGPGGRGRAVGLEALARTGSRLWRARLKRAADAATVAQPPEIAPRAGPVHSHGGAPGPRCRIGGQEQKQGCVASRPGTTSIVMTSATRSIASMKAASRSKPWSRWGSATAVSH